MDAFKHIFGQDAAVTWLRQAYLADRLPHAMIFAGPVGVGKATTAAALAKLFLCDRPSQDQPCGKCDGCRAFDGGNHPDYHVITRELIRFHDKTGKSKATVLAIDVIRAELVEKAGRKAVMGRGKVFIIEQAEYMSAAAQNAMLKTLEEPAGRALIILLTDQPNSLLPTIRSRCQTVRFAPLDEARVQAELVNRGFDARSSAEAAALSRGSPGLSIRWLEDGVIGPAREMTAMLDRIFAHHPADELPGWFRHAADAYAAKQLERDELGSKDQATREGLTLYLVLAGEHLRRRMVASAGADPEPLCSAIEALAEAEQLLDGNVNTSLVLQQLAVRLERVAVPVS